MRQDQKPPENGTVDYSFRSARLRGDRAIYKNGTGAQNLQVNGEQHQYFTPNVPVIFVLGGPGSGKISHCESLIRHRTGYIHINMTETLQASLRGTDLNDTSIIPTSQVSHLLMSAIKKKPQVLGYLVSGYPRNMRDVADYLERIGRLDGVILLNWHDSTLEKQIEYGARLGEIQIDAANKELHNFRKHSIPVAEYFDYKQLLYVISGERQPSFVYEDFLVVFDRILDSDHKLTRPRPHTAGSYREYRNEGGRGIEAPQVPRNPPIRYDASRLRRTGDTGNWPFVVWIVGGPGSCKSEKLEEITDLPSDWHVVNINKLLWNYLSRIYPDGSSSDDVSETARMVKSVMHKGEMVPQGIVIDLVLDDMRRNHSKEGFLISGFPRDIVQAQEFEEQTGLKPQVVLIDCSELELGRNLGKRKGRLDDNLDAYKRRLELYRELTLPMLKTMDEDNRLKIVDGDADFAQVVKELRRALHKEIAILKQEDIINEEDEFDSNNADLLNWSEEFPGLTTTTAHVPRRQF